MHRRLNQLIWYSHNHCSSRQFWSQESPIKLSRVNDIWVSCLSTSRSGSMMTSSNGHLFCVTGLLWGESTGHRWIPSQRPVTQSFDVFFDLRLNKQLSKQWRRRWFETPLCSSWRHCNVRINTGPEHRIFLFGGWPLTGTATTQWSSTWFLHCFTGYHWFWVIWLDPMTLFKMADDTLWNLWALKSVNCFGSVLNPTTISCSDFRHGIASQFWSCYQIWLKCAFI